MFIGVQLRKDFTRTYNGAYISLIPHLLTDPSPLSIIGTSPTPRPYLSTSINTSTEFLFHTTKRSISVEVTDISVMREPSSTQSILKTGSFSGFHPFGELGHGYLSAENTRGQALCGNKEGWGPLSPHRYDFTPCFMDVWVSSVAVYAILFGAVAIWWLVRRKTRAEVEKDWHFWTKQVRSIWLCP